MLVSSYSAQFANGLSELFRTSYARREINYRQYTLCRILNLATRLDFRGPYSDLQDKLHKRCVQLHYVLN